MQIRFFQNVRPLHTPLFFQGRKPQVVFSTDLDECLLEWQLGATERTVNQAKLAQTQAVLQKSRHKLYTGFNTARTIPKIQALQSHFKGIILDFLSLCNGLQIFFRPKGKSTSSWIRSLTPNQADATWQKVIEKKGWQMPHVKKVIRDSLIQLGFQPQDHANPHSPMVGNLEAHGPIEIGFYAPQVASFHFMHPQYSTTLHKASEGLGNQILKTLHQHQIQAEPFFHNFIHQNTLSETPKAVFILGFRPQGIQKGSALGHVVSQLPDVKAVMTAGDNVAFNDKEMLTQPTFQRQDGKHIPNLPILSNTDPQARALMPLSEFPHVTYTEPGVLGPAIQTQLKKLKSL